MRFLRERRGEFLVYRLIGAPISGLEVTAIQKIVGERPEDSIAEPVIVMLDLLLGEPDKAKRIAGIIERDSKPAREVPFFSPGDPGACGLPHHFIQDGNQPPNIFLANQLPEFFPQLVGSAI